MVKDLSDIERRSSRNCCDVRTDSFTGGDAAVNKAEEPPLVLTEREADAVLVCSGAPAGISKDRELALVLGCYKGEKVICGGTTARIISRELDLPLEVVLNRTPSDIPPCSRMPGVDLVTEGVITLSRTKELLKKGDGNISGDGPDAELARILTSHRIIDFIVGTRENPNHYAPGVPMEIHSRTDLIVKIAELLREKYGKQVSIRYI